MCLTQSDLSLLLPSKKDDQNYSNRNRVVIDQNYPLSQIHTTILQPRDTMWFRNLWLVYSFTTSRPKDEQHQEVLIDPAEKNKTLVVTCCCACHWAHYLCRWLSFDGFELIPLNGSPCWEAIDEPPEFAPNLLTELQFSDFLRCLYNCQLEEDKKPK